MERLYYDSNELAWYVDVAPLARATKPVTKGKVVEWLQTQDTYALQKSACKRFPHNPYIIPC